VSDFRSWTIEETDVIFSIFPAGSFARFSLGAEAIYKDTQRVVILGFNEELKDN